MATIVPYNIRLTKPSMASNVDTLDLGTEIFADFENIENSGKIGAPQTRRGMNHFANAPTQLHGASYVDFYGIQFRNFAVADTTDVTLTNQQSIIAALVRDESEAGSSDHGGETKHRGRYVVWDGSDWKELTTHAEMRLNGAVYQDQYSTVLGNENTLFGHSVQGYPIDGLKIGYNAYRMDYAVKGKDSFGEHLQISTGNESNRTYPLMLQYINKPIQLPAATPLRNTGFFYDKKGFSGWYFSKAAPEADELARNFRFVVEADNSTIGAGEVPPVPPGSYTYYFNVILDGVNRTESIAKRSITVRSGVARQAKIRIYTRAGIYNNDPIEPSNVGGGTINIDNAHDVDVGAGVAGIPVTAHNIQPGSKITISGTAGGVYDGDYKVLDSSTANQINITHAYEDITFAGTETISYNISAINVGSWDAFCKRITHIEVWREFTKGSWANEGDMAQTERVDNFYEIGFDSHPPRLLAKIPINNTPYRYDSSNYEENPELYTVYEGTAELENITVPAARTVFKISDAVDVIDGQFRVGVFKGGNVVVDSLEDGTKSGATTSDPGAGYGADGLFNTTLPRLAFDPITPTITDQTVRIRVCSLWVELTGTFEAPDYFTNQGVYYIDVLDHGYDFAKGEIGFIPDGEPIRPNWKGKTLVGEQSFVWDVWEDNRVLNEPVRRYPRRIRYTIPTEGVYPTVFYQGTINISGDEDNDPIQAIVPVIVPKDVDSLRAICLVLFKKNARIMTVTNGQPAIEDEEYQNFGIVGTRCWTREGSVIYGLNEEGMIWRFVYGEGFKFIGEAIQDKIRAFSSTELSRTQMIIDSLPNGKRILWIELNEWDTDSETSPNRPTIFRNDGISQSPCNTYPTGDWYADDAGKGYCNSQVTGTLYQRTVGFEENVTEPKNFGFRIITDTLETSLRSSLDDSVSNYSDIENYRLIYVTKDENGAIWAGEYSSPDASLLTLPVILQMNTSDIFYDIVQTGGGNGNRNFYNIIKTKEFAERPGLLGQKKRLQECIIWTDGASSGQCDVKQIDVTSGSNQTKSLTFAGKLRYFSKFIFDSLQLEFKIQTKKTSVLAAYIFRQIQILIKYHGAKR